MTSGASFHLRFVQEYALNALQQSLQKLNENLSTDFEQSKSVYDEAAANHCSDPTKRQLLNKGLLKRSFLLFRHVVSISVQVEWSKHQKLATKELKTGLSSFCDVGLYNLKIQMLMLEKLQVILSR